VWYGGPERHRRRSSSWEYLTFQLHWEENLRVRERIHRISQSDPMTRLSAFFETNQLEAHSHCHNNTVAAAASSKMYSRLEVIETMLSRRRPRRHPVGGQGSQAPRTACAVLLSTVVVVLSLSTVNGFLSKKGAFLQHQVRLDFLPRRASRAVMSTLINATDTWSRSGSSGDSRFGVRRRVRRVLEKARSRTGRDNFSSPGSAVADAASIGGLYKEGNLVFARNSVFSPAENYNLYTPTSSYGPSNSTSDLVLEYPSTNGQEEEQKMNAAGVDVDALLQSERSVDPLPFKLPKLKKEQKRLLAAGERIQEQSKMGREGSGYVVLDVKAPPYVVWECLLDFEAYPEYMSTVRSMTTFTNTSPASSYLEEKPVLPETSRETRHYGTPTICRASFVLSKFHLKIAAVHEYQPHPDGHFMVFSLDRASKNVVLKDAKGIWYTETNPDGLGEDITRVYLLCELKVSSVLPKFIVDYVAERAMPRATNWLRPTVEAMKKEFQ
jgi:hypothetical protein